MGSFRISRSRLPCWVEWGSLVVAIPLAVLVVSGSPKHPHVVAGAQLEEDHRLSLETAKAQLEQYSAEAHLELRMVSLQHKPAATGEDTRGFVELPVRTDGRPHHFANIRIIPRGPVRRPGAKTSSDTNEFSFGPN